MNTKSKINHIKISMWNSFSLTTAKMLCWKMFQILKKLKTKTKQYQQQQNCISLRYFSKKKMILSFINIMNV